MERIDISGNKYGRWTVLDKWQVKNSHTKVLCRCECGTKKYIDDQSLKTGRSTSCGCYLKSMVNPMFIHGEHPKNGKQTPEYTAWCSMKSRCYQKTNKRYNEWGGKGVKVCERWLNSYIDFLSDMGRKPSPIHSLDRYPNKYGNYEPSNCRWATPKEQSNNTSRNVFISLYGINRTAPEWSVVTGIKRGTICHRVNKGWKVLDALNTPANLIRNSSSTLVNHSFGISKIHH